MIAIACGGTATSASEVDQITLDWAFYNPVSLDLKDQGVLEDTLSADGITVNWVQSAGSNKATEFLNSGSVQFGSTAGAAALLSMLFPSRV